MRPQINPLQRFWAKVDTSGDCWLWTGAIGSHGYGMLTVGSRLNGTKRAVTAHRFSYTHLVGQIPEGLVIDHLCRTRRCVAVRRSWRRAGPRPLMTGGIFWAGSRV